MTIIPVLTVHFRANSFESGFYIGEIDEEFGLDDPPETCGICPLEGTLRL
jgi:hypothetical protein